MVRLFPEFITSLGHDFAENTIGSLHTSDHSVSEAAGEFLSLLGKRTAEIPAHDLEDENVLEAEASRLEDLRLAHEIIQRSLDERSREERDREQHDIKSLASHKELFTQELSELQETHRLKMQAIHAEGEARRAELEAVIINQVSELAETEARNKQFLADSVIAQELILQRIAEEAARVVVDPDGHHIVPHPLGPADHNLIRKGVMPASRKRTYSKYSRKGMITGEHRIPCSLENRNLRPGSQAFIEVFQHYNKSEILACDLCSFVQKMTDRQTLDMLSSLLNFLPYNKYATLTDKDKVSVRSLYTGIHHKMIILKDVIFTPGAVQQMRNIVRTANIAQREKNKLDMAFPAETLTKLMHAEALTVGRGASVFGTPSNAAFDNAFAVPV